MSDGRWVSADRRKRFAYPTKKEALESFLFRKYKQQGYLESQLKVCKESIEKAIELAEGGA
jgi:hypothetical protein